MVGTNITKSETTYMDHIHTPKMSVAKGVRISSCIPLMFKPVKIDNELYVDGGLVKNLDLNMFDEYNIKCMAFDLHDDTMLQPKRSKNLFMYVSKIVNMIHEKANKNVNVNSKTSVCVIHENKINFMNFKLTKFQKQYLKQVGMDEMTKRIYNL